MYEARIRYWDDRTHVVEAGNLDMLKMKCKNFIENDLVDLIYVVKVEDVGYLKVPYDGEGSL